MIKDKDLKKYYEERIKEKKRIIWIFPLWHMCITLLWPWDIHTRKKVKHPLTKSHRRKKKCIMLKIKKKFAIFV